MDLFERISWLGIMSQNDIDHLRELMVKTKKVFSFAPMDDGSICLVSRYGDTWSDTPFSLCLDDNEKISYHQLDKNAIELVEWLLSLGFEVQGRGNFGKATLVFLPVKHKKLNKVMKWIRE